MNQAVGKKLTVKEWNELEKYIRFFVYKSSQVIVQSRFGGKRSQINGKQSAHNWFNLAIEDDAEVRSNAKDACSRIKPLKDFCICTEILLETVDGDTLILETWSLTMNTFKDYVDSPYLAYTSLSSVYSRMTLLLKSIISVTRVTPAFKLSSCQGADTYVMLYRIYSGDPQLDELGKAYMKSEIGQVHTPVGTIKASTYYRSKNNLTITPKRVKNDDLFMLKSDYFKPDINSDKSFTDEQYLETKEAIPKTPSDFRKMGAFALSNNLQDILFPELDMLEKPFLNLARSHFNQVKSVKLIENSDKNANVNEEANDEKTTEVDYNCNTNEEYSIKTISSETQDLDIFMTHKKPPFADCDGDNDIGAFFRDCQSAPPLASFSVQRTLGEQVSDIASQLVKFETNMSDFDKFVESICHLDVKK